MRIPNHFKILPVLFLLAAPFAGAEEIHQACAKGDLAAVKEILDAHPGQVTAVDERGSTPLHIAARQGRTGIIPLLLEKGASLEARTPSGFTPLFMALAEKQSETIRLLLDRGADANAQTKYQTTPLFTAVESGDAGTVRLLLDRGAGVNQVSPFFGSPLHRAAYMDFPETARLLLDAGARLDVRDRRGQTPLHQAAQLGRTELVRLFVERGAELDALDNDQRTPLHLGVLWGTDRSGASNSAEIAFLLASRGAKTGTVDKEGGSPLLVAVRKGITTLAAALLRRGGDVQTVEPGTGRTLLHLAALGGFGDLAELLLAAGAPAGTKDRFGKTALEYAVEHGNPTVALRLVSSIGGMAEPEIGGRILARKLAGDEAYVWRLHNRGWALKTATHLLIFDHEEQGRKPDWPSLSNGWISLPEISGQDIIALYSAYHALPGSTEFIHALENRLPRIQYFNYRDDAWRGGNRTVYLKGREIRQAGQARIIPYETHDEGGMGSLGYLVKDGGLTIFYSNFFPEDPETFKNEIDYLAGQADGCDIAFIDTTPGRENVCANYLIEKLHPRLIIPYSRSGEAGEQEELATAAGRKYPGLQSGLLQDAGARLYYRRGQPVSRRP